MKLLIKEIRLSSAALYAEELAFSVGRNTVMYYVETKKYSLVLFIVVGKYNKVIYCKKLELGQKL